jgi:tRNA threonylcarbamoyladenosine biosynthesis protein TsaB
MYKQPLVYIRNVILVLDSSTEVCAVGLIKAGALVAKREIAGMRHAELMATYVDELLNETGISFNDLKAVAVGKGPGSYTGLRIGTALAKGLCFGANLPLISLSSLQTLLLSNWNALPKADFYIPMFDARRMEVYQQVFDAEGNAIGAIEAQIIDANTFDSLSSKGKVLLLGSGADKLQSLWQKDSKIQIIPGLQLRTEGMITEAEAAFAASRFEDVAYYEPLYLKEFMATAPKVRL